tara:strand:- start:355 stop:1491 length:1137 start_codon:yes stop_codon:yes gene_type:complete
LSKNLKSVLKPLEKASGLSNEYYINPENFQLEKEMIFFNGWAGLSVSSEIPEIGDTKPILFFDIPLLILRDKNKQVRVFQNICRHRGMILINEPKKIEGAIRCPYHSWCYSLEGDLIATPHIGGPGLNTHPDIEKSELGLIEIKSHIWMDVIFINISGDAPPFEIVHKKLIERWREFDQTLYHGGENSNFILNVKSNWKLAVENFCESYHLPWVHPGLNSYSRLEDHYNIEEPGFYSGQGSYLYKQFKSEDGKTFNDFKELSQKWAEGAEYITVFPNVLMACQKDHFWSAIISPISHESTGENINIYYASNDSSEDMKKLHMKLWKDIFLEDIFVVEGMQNGRKCIGFDGGRFSPAMDGPTHLFHSWVANKLLGNKNL